MAETLSPSSGVHPESRLYHADLMPEADDEFLKTLRRKQVAGESLTMAELMRAGRDDTVDMLGDYELKADHVYRAIGKEALDAYRLSGRVEAPGEEDYEFIEGMNNAGIDWYLGAVALKYGSGIILEAPDDPEYFVTASHNGHALAKNPKVRHMKSSGRRNPVPMERIRVIELPSPSGAFAA